MYGDPELFPNNSHMPSFMPNNPQIAPLLAHGQMPPFGSVREMTAIAGGGEVYTPQGPNNMLMKLRAEFPFLPIISFPSSSQAVYLTSNIAQDIKIPEGAVLMCIRGSNEYYSSINGNAKVPTVSDFVENGAFFAPQGILFYCGGLNAISFVAPTTGTVVTAMFWFPSELPRV